MHRLPGSILACFILLTYQLRGQVHILFSLDTNHYKPGNQYFLAGNMNGWKPGDTSYRFDKIKGLPIKASRGDIIEYKITRGTWTEVECGSKGEDISNRVLRVLNDTIITISVAAWKDHFKPVEKKHTASSNVRVLDTAFYIPQLKRTRKVTIYLPPDYYVGSNRYPVLYMADGQNCFDEMTASFGEWHIDESLDRFFDSCQKSLIVVAVDHGGNHRMQEYNPYDFKRFGKGEGKAYARFLAETLKPFIDSSFRTQKDKNNTHVAGSSMGGVISLWTVFAFPKIFGNAGIFSPAFWTAKPLWEEAGKKLADLNFHSFFFYAGGSESKTMVPDTKAMYWQLARNKKLGVQMYIDDLALHNEAAWSKWFPVYLKWIFRN